ncbi:hypothetical protein AAG570_006240 [Ranatra chinensis]|uniref:Uncharacterized protein n=1 Tax=Ranatra chinensis TaxID=642074 RepID=A0ABD0YTD8_9HEMI
MASKRRNMFHKNKNQETTENATENVDTGLLPSLGKDKYCREMINKQWYIGFRNHFVGMLRLLASPQVSDGAQGIVWGSKRSHAANVAIGSFIPTINGPNIEFVLQTHLLR